MKKIKPDLNIGFADWTIDREFMIEQAVAKLIGRYSDAASVNLETSKCLLVWRRATKIDLRDAVYATYKFPQIEMIWLGAKPAWGMSPLGRVAEIVAWP